MSGRATATETESPRPIPRGGARCLGVPSVPFTECPDFQLVRWRAQLSCQFSPLLLFWVFPQLRISLVMPARTSPDLIESRVFPVRSITPKARLPAQQPRTTAGTDPAGTRTLAGNKGETAEAEKRH